MSDDARATLILEVLSWEAVDPEPESWGGQRAEALFAVLALAAEVEQLRAENAELRAAASPFLSLWLSPQVYQRLRKAVEAGAAE